MSETVSQRFHFITKKLFFTSLCDRVNALWGSSNSDKNIMSQYKTTLYFVFWTTM